MTTLHRIDRLLRAGATMQDLIFTESVAEQMRGFKLKQTVLYRVYKDAQSGKIVRKKYSTFEGANGFSDAVAGLTRLAESGADIRRWNDRTYAAFNSGNFIHLWVIE